MLASAAGRSESAFDDEAATTLLDAIGGRIFRRNRDEGGGSFERAWRRGGTDTALDPAALEIVRHDLRERTANWAAAEEGLQLLRRELLDGVDRDLVHAAFLSLDPDSRAVVRCRLPGLPGTEAEVERQRAANALRRSVLRSWAALYYGDGRPGDWFDTYVRAAELRRGCIARNLKRLAGERFDQVQNHRDAAVHALNTSLRIRLLKVPSRAAIGGGGRLRRLFRRSYDGKPNRPGQRS